MSMSKPDVQRLQAAVATSLHQHWVFYLAEGIILVILGLVAFMLPPIATLAVEFVVGWVFLLRGIVGLIATFRMRRAPGFWWSLLSAILGIVAGIALLGWPLSGAFSLTVIVIAFFVIEGVVSIMFALEHKRERSGRWSWMLASVIFIGLPATASWAIGLLVAINMVFGGVAIIAMAMHARTIDPRSLSRAT